MRNIFSKVAKSATTGLREKKREGRSEETLGQGFKVLEILRDKVSISIEWMNIHDLSLPQQSQTDVEKRGLWIINLFSLFCIDQTFKYLIKTGAFAIEKILIWRSLVEICIIALDKM